MFKGYCFFKDGRYTQGVPLRTKEEAVNYARLQSSLHHEVRIVNQEDCIVIQIIEGKLIFPVTGINIAELRARYEVHREYYEDLREKIIGFREPKGSTTLSLSLGGRVADISQKDCIMSKEKDSENKEFYSLITQLNIK